MVGINFLNYMDRWVASAAAPLIQKEFHLSDALVGLLASAFLLVYAFAALPFGYWADRGVRRTVVGVGVTIWSLATLLTGFAQNFFQLFLSRAVLGIGEASYYPAGTSLMSDYFPKGQRGRVMSIWGAGSTIGIAVGFAGGGYIAEKFGWRDAFFFAAVPGILFALLAFRMREPLRGSAEERGAAVKMTREATLKTFLGLLRIPTLRAAIFSQTVLYFVLASNAFLAADAAQSQIWPVRQSGRPPGRRGAGAGRADRDPGGRVDCGPHGAQKPCRLPAGRHRRLPDRRRLHRDLSRGAFEHRANPDLHPCLPDHSHLPVSAFRPFHRRVAERRFTSLSRKQRDHAFVCFPRVWGLALHLRHRFSFKTVSEVSRLPCSSRRPRC